MKKKSFFLLILAVYVFFNSFAITPVSASINSLSISNDDLPNAVDSISVERKNILVPNWQTVKVTIKNNNGIGYDGSKFTGVDYITVSYKLPTGSYTQVRLQRNDITDSTFTGMLPTNYSDIGTYKVENITEYFRDGRYRIYFDKDEDVDGSYQLDDGNFNVYSSGGGACSR